MSAPVSTREIRLPDIVWMYLDYIGEQTLCDTSELILRVIAGSLEIAMNEPEALERANQRNIDQGLRDILDAEA